LLYPPALSGSVGPPNLDLFDYPPWAGPPLID
jgi:hypothetical protein